MYRAGLASKRPGFYSGLIMPLLVHAARYRYICSCSFLLLFSFIPTPSLLLLPPSFHPSLPVFLLLLPQELWSLRAAGIQPDLPARSSQTPAGLRVQGAAGDGVPDPSHWSRSRSRNTSGGAALHPDCCTGRPVLPLGL